MLLKIPVIKGRLKVSSKDIERIDILTKLIFHCINTGVNIYKVSNITNLPKKLILETIEELEKRELIVGDYNGNYKFTENGEKNFNLLNEIEKLNKKEIEVIVDSYTKYIFTKDEICSRYFESENEVIEDKIIEIEKNKYIKHYLKNLDPSNSKEIALNMLDKLTEEDKEGVSVEVKVIQENSGYILGKVKENIEKNSKESKIGGNVVVKREIYKNTYTPVFNSLKIMDKNSIKALETLSKNNLKFVSEAGLEVIEKLKESKENITYYYDPKTKKLTMNKIESDIKEKEIKSLAVIEIKNKEKNIGEEEIEKLKLLKEKYGKDIEFKINVEKEIIYEKFAIEDVIDIYENI